MSRNSKRYLNKYIRRRLNLPIQIIRPIKYIRSVYLKKQMTFSCKLGKCQFCLFDNFQAIYRIKSKTLMWAVNRFDYTELDFSICHPFYKEIVGVSNERIILRFVRFVDLNFEIKYSCYLYIYFVFNGNV